MKNDIGFPSFIWRLGENLQKFCNQKIFKLLNLLEHYFTFIAYNIRF